MAFELIEEVTLANSTTSSITISSIPQDGKELYAIITGAQESASTELFLTVQINGNPHGDTEGVGTDGSSVTPANGIYIGYNTLSEKTGIEFKIPNYADSGQKSLIGHYASVEFTGVGNLWWSSSSAVTSLLISTSSTFSTNTRFELYKLS